MFIWLLTISTDAYGFTCNAQVYSAKTGQAIEWQHFMKIVEQADIVAIGEEHGIKAHTKFAACLINQLSKPQSHALVVEQISSGKQSIIDYYRNEHPEIVSGLCKDLKWWQTGWPSWQIYLPLFNSVRQRKIKLIASDISKVNYTGKIIYNLMTYHGENYQTIHDIWKQRLYSVYCENISAQELEHQIVKQMFRDRHMTQIILNLVETGHKVLFYAGKNHANFKTNLTNHSKKLIKVTISLSGEIYTNNRVLEGINYFIQLKEMKGVMVSSASLNCK